MSADAAPPRPELRAYLALAEQAAAESCRALFADYGLNLSSANVSHRPTANLAFCGVMGLYGRGIKGSLILGCAREVLNRTNPAPTVSVREWIGELTNQLTGRLRNRLLGHGIDVHNTLPAVLHGDHIAPLPRLASTPQHQDSELGGVCVFIDLEFDDSFQADSAGSCATVSEGDALLF